MQLLPTPCPLRLAGRWKRHARKSDAGHMRQLGSCSLQPATAASRASLLTISLEASLESLGSDLAAGNASSGFLLPHNNC